LMSSILSSVGLAVSSVKLALALRPLGFEPGLAETVRSKISVIMAASTLHKPMLISADAQTQIVNKLFIINPPKKLILPNYTSGASVIYVSPVLGLNQICWFQNQLYHYHGKAVPVFLLGFCQFLQTQRGEGAN